jgi:hypothetical protein
VQCAALLENPAGQRRAGSKPAALEQGGPSDPQTGLGLRCRSNDLSLRSFPSIESGPLWNNVLQQPAFGLTTQLRSAKIIYFYAIAILYSFLQ